MRKSPIGLRSLVQQSRSSRSLSRQITRSRSSTRITYRAPTKSSLLQRNMGGTTSKQKEIQTTTPSSSAAAYKPEEPSIVESVTTPDTAIAPVPTTTTTTTMSSTFTPKSPIVAVFDFDCTLSSRHIFHFINNFPHYLKQFHIPNHQPPNTQPDPVHLKRLQDIARRLKALNTPPEDDRLCFLCETFTSQERVLMLKEFLTVLRDRYQMRLMIASRGDKEQILLCLNLVGLSEFFAKEDVYDCHTHKTQLLYHLLYDEGYNVIYFDDTHSEHDQLVQVVQRGNGGGRQNIPSNDTTGNTWQKQVVIRKEFDYFITNHGKTYLFINSLPSNGTGINQELIELFYCQLQDIQL